jgi:signal transduction histidine kinase
MAKEWKKSGCPFCALNCTLEVLVEDDGPGVNPEEFYQGDGMHIGIKNVRERLMQMCGGELIIQSKQGKGTSVIIRVRRE